LINRENVVLHTRNPAHVANGKEMIFQWNAFVGKKASSAALSSYCSGSGCFTFCTGSTYTFFLHYQLKTLGNTVLKVCKTTLLIVSNLDEHFKTWEDAKLLSCRWALNPEPSW